MTAVTSASATSGPLSDDELRRIDAYWRAANYLSVGQIYLLDNPLLREPLGPEHVKPRLLGHWGTTPGLNFIYVHMNRVIRRDDLDAIYIIGPGHGGPATRRQRLPRGDVHRDLPVDHAATRRACGGCSGSSRSRAGSPATSRPRRPGSIHEGGELGYALSTRTAPRSTTRTCSSAASSATARPRPGRSRRAGTRTSSSTRRRDGAVLPILHLNGYKIANPTVLARIPRDELAALLEGYGHRPILVEGDDPAVDAPAAWPPRSTTRSPTSARSSGRPRGAVHSEPPRVADDRPPDAEGLDRPQGDRRRPRRGHLARAPGPDERGPDERRPPPAARGLAPELPPRGAVRRARAARRRARGAAADRHPPDEREPPRQRRRASSRTSTCPTSATTPCRSSGPGRAPARRRACLAASSAT